MYLHSFCFVLTRLPVYISLALNYFPNKHYFQKNCRKGAVAILGGPGWAMASARFLLGARLPPQFFLNFPFKFLLGTYAGLPNAFCKNTGHFVNSARSELCRHS